MENSNEAPAITKEESAYIAGFVDGEGYFGIIVVKSRVGGLNGKRYRIVCKISNTNKEVMDWISDKTNYGLKLSIDDKDRRFLVDKSRRNKTKYTLSFNDQKASKLINIVFPYLIVKKEQAKLCMELQKHIQKDILERGNWGKVSDEHWELRKSYYLKIRELNKKGQKI